MCIELSDIGRVYELSTTFALGGPFPISGTELVKKLFILRELNKYLLIWKLKPSKYLFTNGFVYNGGSLQKPDLVTLPLVKHDASGNEDVTASGTVVDRRASIL